MAPVTEFAILPLESGSSLDDDTSPIGKTFHSLIATLLSQPGSQRCVWACEIENPDTLRLFIDWDGIEDHERFIASPAYKPFMDGWLTIMNPDGAPVLFHVAVSPHPPTAAINRTISPATEILTIYFPPNYTTAQQAAFDSDIAKVFKAVRDNCDALRSVASGWVVEELAVPGSEEEGEKARVYVCLIGWESMEAHEAFRKTQAFGESTRLIRDAEGMKTLSALHVYGNVIEKGDL